MCSLVWTPIRDKPKMGSGHTMRMLKQLSLLNQLSASCKRRMLASVFTVSVCSTVFRGLLECTAVWLKGGSG